MPRASKAAPAKKAVTKKAVKPAPSRAAGAQKTQKAAAAKKAAPVKKTVAKKTAKPAPVKAAASRRAGGAQKTEKTVKKAAPAPKAPVAKKAAAPAPKPAPAKPVVKKKVVLDKFALEQRDLLQEERARHVEQAQELKAEADQMAAEMEPGDVQFDEESGEGTTTAIDRERDLALSMQAQGEVEEVDHALAKLQAGTYGACEHCGQQILKARLRAIPQARLCIACKSGGLSRR